MISIVAKFKVKENLEANFLKVINELGEASRAEEGNIEYVLHRDMNDAATYCLIEKWQDQPAVDFHNNTEHFKAAVPQLGEMAEITIELFETV
jgi:PTH1 family peptidyl-tRNA hydrolase